MTPQGGDKALEARSLSGRPRRPDIAVVTALTTASPPWQPVQRWSHCRRELRCGVVMVSLGARGGRKVGLQFRKSVRSSGSSAPRGARRRNTGTRRSRSNVPRRSRTTVTRRKTKVSPSVTSVLFTGASVRSIYLNFLVKHLG